VAFISGVAVSVLFFLPEIVMEFKTPGLLQKAWRLNQAGTSPTSSCRATRQQIAHDWLMHYQLKNILTRHTQYTFGVNEDRRKSF